MNPITLTSYSNFYSLILVITTFPLCFYVELGHTHSVHIKPPTHHLSKTCLAAAHGWCKRGRRSVEEDCSQTSHSRMYDENFEELRRSVEAVIKDQEQEKWKKQAAQSLLGVTKDEERPPQSLTEPRRGTDGVNLQVLFLKSEKNSNCVNN